MTIIKNISSINGSIKSNIKSNYGNSQNDIVTTNSKNSNTGLFTGFAGLVFGALSGFVYGAISGGAYGVNNGSIMGENLSFLKNFD